MTASTASPSKPAYVRRAARSSRTPRGVTLEIGAGTGINVELYPDAVTELMLSEPDSHMRQQLHRALATVGRPATVLDAGAERLPLAGGTIDTAVTTLVLCTIPDLRAALAELIRVLKPGGIEHGQIPKAPPITRPMIVGEATAPNQG